MESFEFVSYVINYFGMTQEQLREFTAPRYCYSGYTRGVIFDMNKSQMDLFLRIVDFSQEDKTLLDRQHALIMRLDSFPEIKQGVTNYITLWFRIAYRCIQENCKLYVPHQEFQRIKRESDMQIILKGIKQIQF